MSQTATFKAGIAGVTRPAAGARGVVTAPGAEDRSCPGALAGGQGRLSLGAVAGN